MSQKNSALTTSLNEDPILLLVSVMGQETVVDDICTFNMKIAFFRLLIDYNIVSCSKTVDELKIDPKSLTGAPIGEIWVKVERRLFKVLFINV